MDPCSACILINGAAIATPPPGPSALCVALATDLVRCPFLAAFTDNVGDGDCTFRRFLYPTRAPNGWSVVGSSPSSQFPSCATSDSSSAMSCRWGEGWRARGGLSGTEGGGEGTAALSSAGPHQGKQHFHTPTSVSGFTDFLVKWSSPSPVARTWGG